MVEDVGLGRSRMEARFGALGTGRRGLVVGARAYSLAELIETLGLGFEGCRAIDAHELGEGRFAVRYYDPEEQRVVAFEFDAGFRYLSESRVHIAEWVGEAEGALPSIEDGTWSWS